MKKTFWMGIALIGAFAATSCKSSESAYKKAYEKAQVQQTATTTVTPVNGGSENEAVSVTPVQTVTPVTQTQEQTQEQTLVTPVTDYSNETVRAEEVTVVNGGGLKAYSVVVGSFESQTNATVLQGKLNEQGYQAQVVKSPSNMYRVILSTHDDKASAAQARNNVRSTYADAWLLYQK